MIIEFAGLPGAGKSALARRVMTLLHHRAVPVEEALRPFVAPSGIWGRLRKVLYVLGRAVVRPRYCLRCARAIAVSQQRSPIDAVKVLHNWLLVSFLIDRWRRTPGVVVLDQGVFQALWSIGYSARREALGRVADILCPWIPRPDMVILVEVHPLTAERRLLVRPFGGSRLERLRAGRAQAFARGVRVWEDTKELLGRLSTMGGTMHVAVIDNNRDDSLQPNAAKLADDVYRLYRTSASALQMRRLSECAEVRG